MKKAIEYSTPEKREEARLSCCEYSDCNKCPCQIGTDDCIFNYEWEDV